MAFNWDTGQKSLCLNVNLIKALTKHKNKQSLQTPTSVWPLSNLFPWRPSQISGAGEHPKGSWTSRFIIQAGNNILRGDTVGTKDLSSPTAWLKPCPWRWSLQVPAEGYRGRVTWWPHVVLACLSLQATPSTACLQACCAHTTAQTSGRVVYHTVQASLPQEVPWDLHEKYSLFFLLVFCSAVVSAALPCTCIAHKAWWPRPSLTKISRSSVWKQSMQKVPGNCAKNATRFLHKTCHVLHSPLRIFRAVP